MIIKNTQQNRGFVILFAVTIAAILLTIALGVANIAQKEIKFSTSAKDTNEALLSADTGIECALLYDKNNAFPIGGPAKPLTCASSNIIPVFSRSATVGSYDFYISGVGNNIKNCVKVNVTKDSAAVSATVRTTITSKGYNNSDPGSINCELVNPENVNERVLEVTYNTGDSPSAPPSTVPVCDTTFPNDKFNVCYFAFTPTAGDPPIAEPITDGTTPILYSQYPDPLATSVGSSSSPVGTWAGFDHDWGASPLDNAISPTSQNNEVTAIWRGRINFKAGTYTFRTTSDDGVRLNVEGVDVINNWTLHGITGDSASVTFPTAGYRNVQLSWFEHTGGARIRFRWDYSATGIGSGGDITNSGGYTIHTFKNSGTFTAPSTVSSVEVLVVGGGGGGGKRHGGGGGAGGVIYNGSYSVTPGLSIPVTVGGGGAGGIEQVIESDKGGQPGGDSIFGTLTAKGGGGGRTYGPGGTSGAGGSGGGGSGISPDARLGGTGTSGQGKNGGSGSSSTSSGGGGGGASALGGTGGTNGGNGGAGLPYSISGLSLYYGGGGGGGSENVGGSGGLGGGGHGGDQGGTVNQTAGSPNTGGGGGGSRSIIPETDNGSDGGSGVVIIRYPTP
ncbi:MAG: glycine-rich domain-containing protein [Candidatus Paceibacterota bacterium]